MKPPAPRPSIRSAREPAVRALLLLACAAGSIAAGKTQDAPAQAPASNPAGAGTPRPATINGQSITAEDIANHLRLMGEQRDAGGPEERRHLAQRLIAEEILLSSEAARLGVELTDRDVDEYWRRRRGSVPDYALMAEELHTGIERQRELARRSALAEIYLLHKVGLRADLGPRVAPDPLLVRLVTVTPSQLRAAFETNRPFLGTPPALVCDVWACAGATDGAALEQALGEGHPPEGVTPVRRTFPVPALPQVLPQELADELTAAGPGAIRAARATDGVLLITVVERLPATEAEFGTSQEPLRRMLQSELLSEARAQLVATLASQATFYPRDLFATAPPPPAASVANPGTPP